MTARQRTSGARRRDILELPEPGTFISRYRRQTLPTLLTSSKELLTSWLTSLTTSIPLIHNTSDVLTTFFTPRGPGAPTSDLPVPQPSTNSLRGYGSLRPCYGSDPHFDQCLRPLLHLLRLPVPLGQAVKDRPAISPIRTKSHQIASNRTKSHLKISGSVGFAYSLE